jgi:hypothetical protein
MHTPPARRKAGGGAEQTTFLDNPTRYLLVPPANS